MLVCILLLVTHNVDQTITSEDKIYIEKIMTEAEKNTPVSDYAMAPFEQQRTLIQAIQYAAFYTAPEKGLIPMGHPREPKNLYETNAAYCSDRSRFMEKALRFYGLKTRFASLYEKKRGGNILSTLLTKGNDGAHSHAVVEVKTAKGWMVIDSRTHWISLTSNNEPVSLKTLQTMTRAGHWPLWSTLLHDDMFPLMKQDFYILYGLYSRHGRFYAPYTPYMPDLDFPQFMLNFSR